ncbi:DUF445 domain-containing protein [Haliovirga abyssi]|uniref:Membrane protein n=1 Tax=Haliovirga abyssi TaxID=2996794 RepID=A0AAU9DCK7_9FUSO|nr:DUF445 family protein [Haliovirga abyssi]BDU49883.1 membrane protein [Haliovirga abyssi]
MLELLIMVFVGALIGWFTNYLAIKLLFKPYNEINILGFKLQGVIPKRQKEIAENISVTVNEHLISMKDIKNSVNSIEIENEIEKIVDKIVDEKLKSELLEKIPMVGMFLNDKILGKIKEYIKDVLEDNKEELLGMFLEKVEEKVDFKEIVREKIENFSLEEIEALVLGIAKEELKHIEIIGGILGAIIGLVQFFITRVII